MKFIQIPLDEDITLASFDYIADKTVMVFPTRNLADAVRQSFEQSWDLQEIIWLSMEDFKAGFLVSELPLADPEKRLLALYQVLNEEEKEYFHLFSYEDMVGWGQEFFKFLGEYQEAKGDVLQLTDLLNTAVQLREWQEEHIRYLAEIVLRYKEFINALGFEDKVFIKLDENSPLPFEGMRMVFVNQFYYSPFEQELIGLCQKKGSEIYILSYGYTVDEESWAVGTFELKEAYEALAEKPKVRIVQCENRDQTAMSCAYDFKDEESLTIIDGSFWQSSYQIYFDSEKLAVPQQISIKETKWFRLMSFLAEMAENTATKEGFVPLKTILRLAEDEILVGMLLEGWDQGKQDKLLRELFYLADEGYLYLPKSLPQPFLGDKKERYSQLRVLCEKLFAILNKVLSIKDCKDLSELISGELEPGLYLSKDEREKTDALEKIWNGLANFCTAEELGIVKDWGQIFEEDSSGLFALWLSFIKSVNLGYEKEQKGEGWRLSNLLDSRNMRYDKLAFLNVVEGVLPQSPKPVWLLNERQRKLLGILDYDTVRLWERYYFLRLILTAKEVSIYTYSNQDENIHPGSFVGELKDTVDFEELYYSVNYQALFEARWEVADTELLESFGDTKYFAEKTEDSFFILPPDKEKDFGKEKSIRLNGYSIRTFAGNPFMWYIRDHKKLKDRKSELEETVLPTVFGNLMHTFFANLLGDKAISYPNGEGLLAAFGDLNKLKRELLQLIDSEKYQLKLPHNYNYPFLKNIISEQLAYSIQEFYNWFIKEQFKDTRFLLIPEDAPENSAESRLAPVPLGDEEYQIILRGRVDLRIETQAKNYIIDFKTGSANWTQLAFYEWLYYGESPDQDRLLSFFWKILDKAQDDEKVSVSKKDAFKEELMATAQKVLEMGYEVGTGSEFRDRDYEISRSDLKL